MEREFDSKLDAIMAKPGVVGVVCTDKRGLCVAARGVGVTYDTGVISSIADHARKLDPISSATPIIRLESDQGFVFNFSRSIGKLPAWNNDHLIIERNRIQPVQFRLTSKGNIFRYCLVQKREEFALAIFKKYNY